MLIQTKKIILVLIIVSICTVTMLFVYQDFLRHQLPKKDLLDPNVLIIYPGMSEVAYQPDSFYQFYKGVCDECKTHSLNIQKGNRYVLGLNANDFFYQNYYSINDLDLNKLPPLLHKYHTLILLHNEYVTQYVFEQITKHPNVIYLYPNALYVKVSVDFTKNIETLERGHDYPVGVANGFDWRDDNSKEEIDCKEGQWYFRNVTNGIQLDCYPENIIRTDKALQKYIHDYIESSKMNIPNEKIISLEKLK